MNDDRFHPGTFTAGVFFFVLGLAFTLEAADVWTFRLEHFKVLGPLTLVAIGLAVLVASTWSRAHPVERETDRRGPD
jgi:hypothetical protein